MDAAWLLVPAAAVVVLFLWASLRLLLSPNSGHATELVATVGFYVCLFVCAVILLGLLMERFVW